MLSSANSASQNIPVSLFADPEFRRDLAADPIATLAAHGIKIDESDLPDEIRLPDLDELARKQSDPTSGNEKLASLPGGDPPVADPFPRGPQHPNWTIFLG